MKKSKKVAHKITVEGSKSISNRLLVIDFIHKLQNKPSLKISNLGTCEDIKYMQQGLKQLTKKNPGTLHLGNAGTTVRFLTALASCLNKKVEITGEKRMLSRPIKDLTNALNKLGAKVKTAKNGCPPVKILPSKPLGGTIEIPGDKSSQYITALLLISPLLPKGLKIKIKGSTASKPYIEMTKKLIEQTDHKSKITVESDASSASYIGAFAALTNQTVEIQHIPTNSFQGDIKFKDYLKKMGCKITHQKNTIKITGTENLKPLGIVNMNKTPDLVMTFAILATQAPGKTKITNISNLRIKESDRLQALKNEIKKLGIKVETTKDSITIHGRDKNTLPKNKITINTYNDHRIAMAFGILQKSTFPNLVITRPEVVKKSYPNFWKDLNSLTKTNK